MSHVEYKLIEQKKTINNEGESIIDLVNRNALESWMVHTIDFHFGRALLARVVDDIEPCCVNGECSCQAA